MSATGRLQANEFGGGAQNNTIGSGGIFWSPNGLRIAFSARDTCPVPTCPFAYNPCRIKWVFSDPALGSTVFKLTFNGAAADSKDYNPSWSPLGGYVYYDRSDVHIRRKGVPGLSGDTTDVLIIGGTESKTLAQISPNGDSLAYIQAVSGLG